MNVQCRRRRPSGKPCANADVSGRVKRRRAVQYKSPVCEVVVVAAGGHRREPAHALGRDPDRRVARRRHAPGDVHREHRNLTAAADAAAVSASNNAAGRQARRIQSPGRNVVRVRCVNRSRKRKPGHRAYADRDRRVARDRHAPRRVYREHADARAAVHAAVVPGDDAANREPRGVQRARSDVRRHGRVRRRRCRKPGDPRNRKVDRRVARVGHAPGDVHREQRDVLARVRSAVSRRCHAGHRETRRVQRAARDVRRHGRVRRRRGREPRNCADPDRYRRIARTRHPPSDVNREHADARSAVHAAVVPSDDSANREPARVQRSRRDVIGIRRVRRSARRQPRNARNRQVDIGVARGRHAPCAVHREDRDVLAGIRAAVSARSNAARRQPGHRERPARDVVGVRRVHEGARRKVAAIHAAGRANVADDDKLVVRADRPCRPDADDARRVHAHPLNAARHEAQVAVSRPRRLLGRNERVAVNALDAAEAAPSRSRAEALVLQRFRVESHVPVSRYADRRPLCGVASRQADRVGPADVHRYCRRRRAEADRSPIRNVQHRDAVVLELRDRVCAVLIDDQARTGPAVVYDHLGVIGGRHVVDDDLTEHPELPKDIKVAYTDDVCAREVNRASARCPDDVRVNAAAARRQDRQPRRVAERRSAEVQDAAARGRAHL